MLGTKTIFAWLTHVSFCHQVKLCLALVTIFLFCVLPRTWRQRYSLTCILACSSGRCQIINILSTFVLGTSIILIYLTLTEIVSCFWGPTSKSGLSRILICIWPFIRHFFNKKKPVVFPSFSWIGLLKSLSEHVVVVRLSTLTALRALTCLDVPWRRIVRAQSASHDLSILLIYKLAL